MCSDLHQANSLIVRSDMFSLAKRISIKSRFSVGSVDPVHRLNNVSESIITAKGIFACNILLMSSLTMAASSTLDARKKVC